MVGVGSSSSNVLNPVNDVLALSLAEKEADKYATMLAKIDKQEERINAKKSSESSL